MHNTDPSTQISQETWQVPAEQVGTRLDRFLTPILNDLSRTAIQQLIADQSVLVNGRNSKPGYALRSGDEVTILRKTIIPQQRIVQPQQLPLTIVYEDEDLLVINKAPGMVVHPAPGHSEDTVVNALVARYPQLQQIEGDLRPGIVHRLDRDTSGLLIVAKNARAQAALIEQMKQHAIIKRYLALVEGIVALDQGSIDAPIGRHPRFRQQMAITATQSRDAITHFRVLKRFQRHTLLLLQLETGRTHQIRVHLQAIGHPVVGDPIYGSGHTEQRGIRLKRQFLHAYQLEFSHPLTDVPIKLEAPLPDDLQAILEQENLL